MDRPDAAVIPSSRPGWPCPIARVLDLVGERWTVLVLRQCCLYGTQRYDQFVEQLAIPRPVLSKRLARLCEEGMLTKRPYEERPPRWEYVLTGKGHSFYDVLASMWSWGLEWQWSAEDPPLVLLNRSTGAEIRPIVVDERTGERLDVRQLQPAIRRRRNARPSPRRSRPTQ